MQKNSRVFFTSVKETDTVEAVGEKLRQLIDKSRLFDILKSSDKAAVKIHFGEEGNTGHVRSDYAGVICRKIKDKGAVPFLADTNTLYRGRRVNSKEHMLLAAEHGFTKEKCGAEVVVPDDTRKENVAQVEIGGKFFKTAKVAAIFLKADCIVGVAHFKGHIMTGFGGALKNIGMGCASREGKLAQHSDVTPVVNIERCCGCMACIKSCPVDAICLKDDKAVIDPSKCIGCATCIAACVYNAMEIDWAAGGRDIQDKMIEYAYAVLKEKKKHSVFINFATKITKECDCLAKDDPRIAPDIGIFISHDPVAVDKACCDAIIRVCGKDVFKDAHPDRDGSRQLKRAHELGLGELDYELIEL